MSRFSLPDMTCGHCKATVEKTVHAADPAAKLAVDLDARQITLESGKLGDVLSALAEEGYPANPA